MEGNLLLTTNAFAYVFGTNPPDEEEGAAAASAPLPILRPPPFILAFGDGDCLLHLVCSGRVKVADFC